MNLRDGGSCCVRRLISRLHTINHLNPCARASNMINDNQYRSPGDFFKPRKRQQCGQSREDKTCDCYSLFFYFYYFFHSFFSLLLISFYSVVSLQSRLTTCEEQNLVLYLPIFTLFRKNSTTRSTNQYGSS